MDLITEPSTIYKVKGEFADLLNFDFIISNTSDQHMKLNKLSARFIDQNGKLILYKYLDRNAIVPSIETTEHTLIPAGKSVSFFNPFHMLNPEISFDTIHYEIIAENEAGDSLILDCMINPIEYPQKNELRLPLHGKLLVYDGYEYHAHHRRVDLTHPMLKKLGIRSNYVRYAVDFCVIDENDRIFLNRGKQKEDWHSLGAKVYAPASGKVTFSQNEIPENLLGDPYAFEDMADESNYLNLSLGNCVCIDHGNHEYSIFAHLMEGSVLVQNGEMVEVGQQIARVGFSGDTGSFVHLHYMLTSHDDIRLAEALPITFSNFYKIRGDQKKAFERGTIETGEIVQHIP